MIDGATVVIATQHGKERFLAPILEGLLNVGAVITPHGLDTDAFGTFTGEVPRRGTMLDAALAKAEAGLRLCPEATVGLGSEGAFGADPTMPLALGTEIVVLVDRHARLRAVGQHRTHATNWEQLATRDRSEAFALLDRIGLPAHAAIVSASKDGTKDVRTFVQKGIVDRDEARAMVDAVLRAHGEVFVEPDMRAHLNATRRAAIAEAAMAACERALRACSRCGGFGFGVWRSLPGLPCADCATPTSRARARELRCELCGHTEEESLPVTSASPHACPACNP